MEVAPKYVLNILSRLTEAGHEAYMVGGCVRDLFLGRRPGDFDVASSASPEQVAELFSRTVPTGVRHGTVTVLSGDSHVEVTAFRVDGDYRDHRRPESVKFVSDIVSDLGRRDFTVNAMAMDAGGGVLDPYGGRADLARRVIRCVGLPDRRFEEDALRMLRALRFSAQLGFLIEPDTRAAIERSAALCASLSAERVRDEVRKALMSPRPDAVWEMASLGLLSGFLSGQAPPDRGPALASLPHYARWARLCAALEREGLTASAGAFLTSLRLDRATVRDASAAAAILRSGSRDYKRLLRDYGEAAVLAACPRSAALRRVLRSGECWSVDGLEVSGADMLALGLEGREIGDALDWLVEAAIESPEQNQRQILCKLIEERYGKDG